MRRSSLLVRYVAYGVALLLLCIVIAGCGGSSANSTSAPSRMPANQGKQYSSDSSSTTGSTSTGSSEAGKNQSQGSTTPDAGPQYLVKTLKIAYQVKNTRKTAADLQTWIASTDQNATSSGTSYSQSGSENYAISLTYAVQSSLYPQIYNHLRDYSLQKGERLISMDEAVQDVTTNYINTQSRIKNLKTEQTRLLELMKQASALADVLTIEQKLTDVEGQLETFEAQLKNLTSQVSYYTVVISLYPTDVPVQPTPTPGDTWSITSVFSDAFTASLALGKTLLSFVIWLLAFSIYIVPALFALWFGRRWFARHTPFIPAPTTPPSLPKED